MIAPDALVRALRDAAFVVVQAPAGFGKTASVREALAGAPDVAWYDAQPWESDVFVAPLLERIRTRRPDAGRLAAALAEQGADAERVAAALAAELARIDAPLRIVIDDAHVLGEQFSPFVRTLTRRLPRSVRLVILTRTPLDVGLAEATASGNGALVDADALRFDLPRTRALARASRVVLDDRRAAALLERTGGWPIATALALRAPDAEHLVDELIAHALGALNDDQRALLRATVAYATIEPDVVAPGDATVAERLRTLAADSALVQTTDEGFRVQPLVRDALSRTLDERARAALDTSAAAAYASAGRLGAALHHLERAADARADAAFLRTHARAAVASRLTDDVRRAVTRVRAAGVDAAVVALVEGLLARARGADAREAFALAAREADAANDADVAFDARLHGIESDLARGVAVARDRIEDLLGRAARRGPRAVALAAVRAGWADVLDGAFARALGRIEAVDADAGDEIAADVVPLEAYARTALGDVEGADRAVTRLIDRLASADDLMRYASALGWAARFALLRGDTTAAYEMARESERVSRPFAPRAESAAIHVTLADAAVHVGDTALARVHARAAFAAADDAWYGRDAERTRALAIRLLARADALDGDASAALGALDATDALTLADAAAVAALERAPDAAWRRDAARAALRDARAVDAADAVSLWAAAGMLDALDAHAGRVARTSLRPTPFDGLIARRAEADAGPSFEQRIVARVTTSVERDATLAPPEPLTAREHEILELLAGGFTNREIAQRLVLSARTVETHVARITGKLGVNSRARAVARAVALRLVEPPSAVTA